MAFGIPVKEIPDSFFIGGAPSGSAPQRLQAGQRTLIRAGRISAMREKYFWLQLAMVRWVQTRKRSLV
jgi:hypothetical protein